MSVSNARPRADLPTVLIGEELMHTGRGFGLKGGEVGQVRHTRHMQPLRLRLQ